MHQREAFSVALSCATYSPTNMRDDASYRMNLATYKMENMYYYLRCIILATHVTYD